MDRREFLKISTSYALLAGLGSGCAHKLVPADNLVVQDGFEHPYTVMSWSEGASRLHGIASSYETDKEEAWLVTEIDGKEDLLWVDVGCFQESARTHVSRDVIDTVTDVMKHVIRGGARVKSASCHIHPIAAVIYGLQQIEGMFDGEPKLDGLVHRYQAEIGSLPSPGDLGIHIEIRKYLREKKNYDIEHSWVVTPTGMYVYDTKPSLERLYFNSGDEAMEFVILRAMFRGFQSRNLDTALKCLRQEGLNITHYRIEPQILNFPIRI